MKIQWYPGHMAKAKRNIRNDLKLVDLVIEIIDARCPIATSNPDVKSFAKEKARVILLNKTDLADASATREFKEYFIKNGYYVLEIDARSKTSVKKLNNLIDKACLPIIERNEKKGIRNTVIKAMVLGVPNVGKSTFINSYVGKAMTKTGNKPGVTRGNQWINVNKKLQLLDTPGITWPKFERELTGINLAIISSINDDILNIDELVLYLLKYLLKYYPEAINERYNISVTEDNEVIDIYEQIGKRRGCVKKGGLIDFSKTARIILDDYRSGRLGRITLEHVPGEMDEECVQY